MPQFMPSLRPGRFVFGRRPIMSVQTLKWPSERSHYYQNKQQNYRPIHLKHTSICYCILQQGCLNSFVIYYTSFFRLAICLNFNCRSITTVYSRWPAQISCNHQPGAHLRGGPRDPDPSLGTYQALNFFFVKFEITSFVSLQQVCERFVLCGRTEQAAAWWWANVKLTTDTHLGHYK